jgi:hypothetical protein
MRYKPAVDIWETDPNTLQVGQWVYAGKNDNAMSRGRFLGITQMAKVVVVAWQGNATKRKDISFKEYTKLMRDFAKGDR